MPKFIALLLTLTAIDYTAGLWLERAPPGPRRKAAADLQPGGQPGLSRLLQVLQFPGGATWRWLLGRPANAFFLDIVLPLGISFHTFQSMSYVVDVYRGEQQRRAQSGGLRAVHLLLPATGGRADRARARFLPRPAATGSRPRRDEVSRGVFLMVLGLTKKMAFADQFAQVANGYFDNVAAHPGVARRLERRRSPSACRSTSISPATPTWRSAWRSCWASTFPINFRRPVPGRQHHRLLAALAHFALDAGCATTSTFRWAATATARWHDLPQPDAHHAAGRACGTARVGIS